MTLTQRAGHRHRRISEVRAPNDGELLFCIDIRMTMAENTADVACDMLICALGPVGISRQPKRLLFLSETQTSKTDSLVNKPWTTSLNQEVILGLPLLPWLKPKNTYTSSLSSHQRCGVLGPQFKAMSHCSDRTAYMKLPMAHITYRSTLRP